MLGDFATSGAMRLDSAANDQLAEFQAALAGTPTDRAGVRLARAAGLEQMLGPTGAIGAPIARFAGTDARAVRAILFDKSDRVNWSLAWHQDRTIRVRARREVPGFGPWTVKAGLLHVAPPFEILERMVTIRIHLDDVPLDNAPLLIAPGSHRFGLVREDRIAAVVGQCGVYACTARAGDIWVYATPIVHASDAAATPRRRLVLQIDYAGFDLPGGLEWSGI
ncbi:phytanoyl-CoA dioxygenase family protein [Sphingomonas sp.]|jgi:hypothetical protein|uniref:phytanoyl-CoA dioxygenase family protein n=1 Tax=Sphingomonas sp. TaxID=28214 RepID=UPI002E108B56|nr:phytanoyl-CoA dioxygenase family protein [Sphingomonas sp.]